MSSAAIEFLGAARTVTGSMHLLHAGERRVLLDCGLFQGRRQDANERNKHFPFDPKSIDAVILSHAHIDHSGNLPGLVRQGYAGPIYSTSATRDLCGIMLADSAHIQEKDAEYLNKKLERKNQPLIEPLYLPRDAAATMTLFRELPYGKEVEFLPQLTASFTDAGHILGSASIRLNIRTNGTSRTLGFTGDVGRWNTPIIRDPMFMGEVDSLISESTYGGITHDPPSDMRGQLGEVLRRTFNRGGKVIVPAFSVGRTQDLVYALHQLQEANALPDVPVFVDSPLAIDATEIYKNHPECYDEETRSYLNQHQDPLGLSRLHYVRTAEESRALNDRHEPCLIIAASGMCEAGRILHHLANTIQDPKNTIVIVGYQAQHTLGRKLVDREEEVKIFGELYRRNADVVVLNSFSAHADGPEMVRYLSRHSHRRLGRIFLVHGEFDRQQLLKESLAERGYGNVDIPVRGNGLNCKSGTTIIR